MQFYAILNNPKYVILFSQNLKQRALEGYAYFCYFLLKVCGTDFQINKNAGKSFETHDWMPQSKKQSSLKKNVRSMEHLIEDLSELFQPLKFRTL